MKIHKIINEIYFYIYTINTFYYVFYFTSVTHYDSKLVNWSKYIYGRKEEGGEAVKGGDRMEVKKEKVKGGR